MSEYRNQIIHGDCLEVLAGLPENVFDSCITDPPYGMSSDPDMLEVLTHWMSGEKYVHTDRGGMMNKSWDSFVPGPEYWRAVYRVLKPGAYLLAFASTRTWDLMSIAIRLAGFENRDTIACFGGNPGIAWVHAQGFPKGLDVSRAVDQIYGMEREVIGPSRWAHGNGGKREKKKTNVYGNGQVQKLVETAAASLEAKRWAGWNTSLKPAWECVLVFRKPIREKTIAANVVKWGTGAVNVEGCRINVNNGESVQSNYGSGTFTGDGYVGQGREYQNDGRWPANVILMHTEHCECFGTNSVRSHGEISGIGGKATVTFGDGYKCGRSARVPFPDGTETVELWRCLIGCPRCGKAWTAETKQVCPECGCGDTEWLCAVKMLDEQLSIRKDIQVFVDTGGASRFFYCGKASPDEWDLGCRALPLRPSFMVEGGSKTVSNQTGKQYDRKTVQRNSHPTLKPISLIRYLVRLVTQKGGLVLDPFLGSGTTCLAALREGMEYCGVEREDEYAEIARARLASAIEHPLFEEEVSTKEHEEDTKEEGNQRITQMNADGSGGESLFGKE